MRDLSGDLKKIRSADGRISIDPFLLRPERDRIQADPTCPPKKAPANTGILEWALLGLNQ